MNDKLRVFAAGLMLGTAALMTVPAPSAHAAGTVNLEQSIDALRQDAAQMERRELRANIKALKESINSTNRREHRAKIRLLRSELKARKASKATKQAEKTRTKTAASGEFKVAQSTAQERNRAVRKFVRGSGPSGKLTPEQLRSRISRAQNMLQWQELRPKVRDQLEALVARDRRELTSRQAGTQENTQPAQGTATKKERSNVAGTHDSSQADRLAGGVLSDDRPSRSLSDDQLRSRLKRTREVLSNKNVSRRYSRELREYLGRDRRELRSRMNTRRAGTKQTQAPTNSALLDNPRPARDLLTPQLSVRIQRTRGLLADGNLTSGERTRLRNLLERDRRELRSRLVNRRDRRKGDIARWLRNNEINIVIAPQGHYEPREDIAFAEVDDGLIERQLVAPPRRRIERRYTFDEYRRAPELRDAMPAIDVDSINFGFNEAFIREEEIEGLERLGAIIERIVAKHPNEVFLIEGHTDAVGSDGYNLGLSQQRADAVRQALLEYFVIDPRNLQTIGYGERHLKVYTEEPEEENRRVSVRRITPFLARN